MLDILTIGDIKWDVFLAMPEAQVTGGNLCIPYGKKNPVQLTHAQIAGTAPNVAVGAAKMRLSGAVVSTMGKDMTHALAVDFLAKHKVETRFIQTDKRHQSSFAAVVNVDGESTQLVAHNPATITLPKSLPAAQWLHLAELGEGYERLFLEVIAYAMRHHVKISVNPGQVQLQERKPVLFELLAQAQTLFLNLREARELLEAPKASIVQVLHALSTLGPDEAIVTDGTNGAYAFDGEELWHAPMFPGERVEATGAGDAFCTGYLGARLYEKSIQEALSWGSVNAASVVGSIGPTAGLLSHTEIRHRLKANLAYHVVAV